MLNKIVFWVLFCLHCSLIDIHACGGLCVSVNGTLMSLLAYADDIVILASGRLLLQKNDRCPCKLLRPMESLSRPTFHNGGQLAKYEKWWFKVVVNTLSNSPVLQLLGHVRTKVAKAKFALNSPNKSIYRVWACGASGLPG